MSFEHKLLEDFILFHFCSVYFAFGVKHLAVQDKVEVCSEEYVIWNGVDDYFDGMLTKTTVAADWN